jgi:Cys-tRNA synthase (O-phospho-L-seryl-tRNA:Cys-tRNA synthase)
MIGSLTLFIGFNIFKIYYLNIGEPLFNYDFESEKQNKIKKDIEDIVFIKQQLDSSNEHKIIKLGKESVESINEKFGQKLFAINKSINFRDNINKYYEKYKINNK